MPSDISDLAAVEEFGQFEGLLQWFGCSHASPHTHGTLVTDCNPVDGEREARHASVVVYVPLVVATGVFAIGLIAKLDPAPEAKLRFHMYIAIQHLRAGRIAA